LQVVGEKLSLHVLANYEEFVRGVNEVASIAGMQTATHYETGSKCSNRMLIVMHAMGSAPHPEVMCVLDALCFSALHNCNTTTIN